MPAKSRWDLIRRLRVNTQTLGKYPEDNLSLLQHGERLKTRTFKNVFYTLPNSKDISVEWLNAGFK